MPGRTVTELERRYGRPGSSVLEALRAVAVAKGRIDAADVDRVAAELRLPRAHVNGAGQSNRSRPGRSLHRARR